MQVYLASCWCLTSSLTVHKGGTEPSVWLQITEDSVANLSHFLRLSYEMRLDSGGIEAIPACLAILR